MRSQRLKRAVAASIAVYGALVLGAVLTPVVATAANGDGPVDISNRETVNAKLKPSGEVDLARVYDQVTVTGSGEVEFTNPISTKGLRNLDGFGSPELSGEEIVSSVDADGQATQRYVADFTKELPVEVRITYRLDGQELDAEDVVGKSGELEVNYRVENVTGEPTQVTYEDGTGGKASSREMVYIPLAATMDIILPNSMTAVEAPAGAVAGDGRGGTKLKYSITLIPPLSNPVAEVSYKADVTDAVIPPANLTIAVIRPLENPTVSSAKKSFEDGAKTGQDLTSGAQQIDENLLKLQDGAGQLLAGLLQLEDGASQLSAGLNDTALPGAEQLNDGAQELSAGLNGTAVPGSELLADGAQQLAAGLTGTAVPGSNELAAGSAELSAGLDQLQSQVPALVQGVAALAAGSTLVANGLNTLEAGLDAPLPNGFGAGLDALSAGLSTLPATVAGLKGAVASIATLPDCGPAACQPTVNAIVAQISAEEPDIQLAAGTAAALNNGYKTQIRPGIGQASGGADQVAAGLAQLNAQLGPLAAGVAQLAAGAELVADGNAELASGLSGAADGAEQVADGADDLSVGLVSAADGASQIADGTQQLEDGLADAADGGGQIADGLGQAVPGVEQIESGAGQLSEEGSQQLLAAGNATALDFGTRVAVIEASAERTADGGLPYGAPEDSAQASAAYSYDIAGAGGASDSNLARLIAALVLLGGAAAGAYLLAQRS